MRSFDIVFIFLASSMKISDLETFYMIISEHVLRYQLYILRTSFFWKVPIIFIYFNQRILMCSGKDTQHLSWGNIFKVRRSLTMFKRKQNRNSAWDVITKQTRIQSLHSGIKTIKTWVNSLKSQQSARKVIVLELCNAYGTIFAN